MVSCRKRLLCSLVLLFGFVSEAVAELGVEFGIEDFRWREFDAGARLLEESGRRYRIGASWRQPLRFDQRDSIFVRASLYFGSVDYDGQACTLSGLCVPFQTDSDYLGTAAEVSFAHGLGLSGSGEIFGGVGIDSWERDVRGRADVAGAIENWTVFYLFAGGGGRWQHAGARYHLQAGAKFPFFTYELADSFDVTLEPKGRASLFARLGTDFMAGGKPQWGFGLYYDSYRFAMSDVERVGSIFVWQPESEQDVIGFYGTFYLN